MLSSGDRFNDQHSRAHESFRSFFLFVSRSCSQWLALKCCFFLQIIKQKEMLTKTELARGVTGRAGVGGQISQHPSPPSHKTNLFPLSCPSPLRLCEVPKWFSWPTHHGPQKSQRVGRQSKQIIKVKCETLTRMRHNSLNTYNSSYRGQIEI